MYQYKARYLSNYDGDTCVLSIDLGFSIEIKQVIRLRGVDTAELKTGDRKSEGKAAKEWLAERLAEKNLEIRTYRDDKYGRMLADITIDGENVNQQMIDLGLAVPYFGGKK